MTRLIAVVALLVALLVGCGDGTVVEPCPEVAPCTLAIGCAAALTPCDPEAKLGCADGLTCQACVPTYDAKTNPYGVRCVPGCFICL